jgi:hypothetical protein
LQRRRALDDLNSLDDSSQLITRNPNRSHAGAVETYQVACVRVYALVE